MTEQERLALEKLCPGNHQSCTVNWTQTENGINRLMDRLETAETRHEKRYLDLTERVEKRLVVAEERVRHLPQGFEFRVICALMLMLYLGTNPATAEPIKKWLGI